MHTDPFRLQPLVLLALLVLTGCAASRPASMPSASVPANHEQLLRDEVDRWLGTPHRWGGLSMRGVDCSGFVVQVYRSVYAMQLPRVTREQARVGTAVRRDALQLGDLVFFRLPKTRHVGIYLGDGTFAHASSSQGVMISRLDEPYWIDGYWTARRVLPSIPGPYPSVPSTASPPTPAAGRTGW